MVEHSWVDATNSFILFLCFSYNDFRFVYLFTVYYNEWHRSVLPEGSRQAASPHVCRRVYPPCEPAHGTACWVVCLRIAWAEPQTDLDECPPDTAGSSSASPAAHLIHKWLKIRTALSKRRCDAYTCTYSRKVVAAWLYGLYEESAGCWISVHSTDEILHWRLMGKTNQIAHMIYSQPRQMLRVMQVLTLKETKNKYMTIFVLLMFFFFFFFIWYWMVSLANRDVWYMLPHFFNYPYQSMLLDIY